MSTYYRTIIEIEVLSLGQYYPNSIYDVEQDIKGGPQSNLLVIEAVELSRSYTIATTEQVDSITKRKADPSYRHYKHKGVDHPAVSPTTQQYKTTIEIEVLSKSEYTVGTLCSLEYDMLSGHCLGVWSVNSYSNVLTEPSITHYMGAVEIDYWNMQQDNYQNKMAFLTNHNKEELVAAIMSYHYNAFCKDNADVKNKDHDKRPSGKNIPYIGWFWRNVDFCGCVPIGSMEASDEGPGFIGFIGNNKWDYPERDLTDNERHQVICYLDRAMARGRDGHREAVLGELWDYMQTLSIP
jgi:hypothetical protein